MMDSEREYRDRFFISTKDREPELGRYCVVNIGSFTYEIGMFIDTPWDGVVFLCETGNTLKINSATYAYIEELKV